MSWLVTWRDDKGRLLDYAYFTHSYMALRCYQQAVSRAGGRCKIIKNPSDVVMDRIHREYQRTLT